MRIMRSGRLEPGSTAQSVGRSAMGQPANADDSPLQSWRAWSECGDGVRLHLVLDPAAGQVWLLPAEETLVHARSIG